MTDFNVVIPGSDPESEAIRRWIDKDRPPGFVLASSMPTRSHSSSPRAPSDPRRHVLVAPRDPSLVALMQARDPALLTIDHVTLLGVPGYDFAGKPSCLAQFAAFVRAQGATFKPSDSAAIAAAASGGLPGFAAALWAEAGHAPLFPNGGRAARLADLSPVLQAEDWKDAAKRWQDGRRETPNAPWRERYNAVHGRIRDRYDALWGGTGQLDGTSVIFDGGGRRTLTDPRLVVARIEAAPVCRGDFERLIAHAESWAFDRLYQSRGVPPMAGADLVLLFIEPGGRADCGPWAVVALVGGARNALFAEMAGSWMRASLGASELVCEGMAAGERARLVWRTPDDSASAALHDVVTQLLDELLGGNRPLGAWRSSWLQFVQDVDGCVVPGLRDRLQSLARENRSAVSRESLSAEERAYFLDRVRATLAPDGDPAPRAENEVLLSFKIEAEIKLDLHHAAYPEPLPAVGEHFRVHLFHQNCMIFEWTAAGTHERLGQLIESGQLWWLELLGDDQPPTSAVWPTLAEFLDRNRHARYIYSPFLADPDEDGTRHVITGEIDGETLPPLFFGMGFSETADGKPIDPGAPQGWLCALIGITSRKAQFPPLAEALGTEGKGGSLRLLEDERGHVIASAVAVGKRPVSAAAFSNHDPLLHRALEVDGFGAGFSCDPEFARRELQAGHYTRFATDGSDFLISDHSFVYLGFGRYALREIHRKHMQGTYRRMFLFTQFHAAILNAFAADLRNAYRHDNEWRQGKILRNFERFTSQVWCDQVTTQIEGAELFAIMRERASAATQYDYLHGEIQEASERERNQIAAVLSILGVFGGPLLFFPVPLAEIRHILIGRLDLVLQVLFWMAVSYPVIWSINWIVKASIGRSPLVRIAMFRYFAPFRIAEDGRASRWWRPAACVAVCLICLIGLPVVNALRAGVDGHHPTPRMAKHHAVTKRPAAAARAGKSK